MAVICKNHENHGKISASIHTPKRDVFINTCIYSSAVLHQKLDLDEITAVLRTRRLRLCQKWYDYMQPGWCQPVRQEFMENECKVLPGVAYPGVRDNRSTLNTKTGYDDDDDDCTKV